MEATEDPSTPAPPNSAHTYLGLSTLHDSLRPLQLFSLLLCLEVAFDLLRVETRTLLQNHRLPIVGCGAQKVCWCRVGPPVRVLCALRVCFVCALCALCARVVHVLCVCFVRALCELCARFACALYAVCVCVVSITSMCALELIYMH
jgi:hypothetical protein